VDATLPSCHVIATQEMDGKELVWMEKNSKT
jgi:hypothetical protein